MLESVTLTLPVGGMVLAILTATGCAYDVYAARVPRIVPDLSGFRTPPRVTVDMGTLARNTRDALVFLSLIPLAEALDWLHAAHLLRGIAL